MTWIVVYLQAATLAFIGFILFTLTTLERTVMSLQDTVDHITEELARAYGEIKAELAKVQAQVDAAGATEQVDLTALQAAADMLDGIVPDETTEPEGDELELVKRDDTDEK
jgi:hypothetical protein